jgi:hypothetical protein
MFKTIDLNSNNDSFSNSNYVYEPLANKPYNVEDSNILFDSNGDSEDYEFVNKLRNTTHNFIITPEVYYNVRH